MNWVRKESDCSIDTLNLVPNNVAEVSDGSVIVRSMKEERIFLSPPDIGPSEFAAFERVFDSGWFAPAGPELERFEAEVARISDRQFAVALNSGTAALHLALIAAGIGRGDYVACSTMTFVATANAIAYVGAIPIFVDSEVSTGNMSAVLLEELLHKCSAAGIRPSAVVVVDFLGKVADYDAIARVVESWSIPIISDAAESLGSFRDMKPAGGFGQSAIFSFNGNKIATTSGGGMLLTDSEEIANRVRFLSTQAKSDAPHYQHDELGYNYRLSNVLAAIGRAQIARLEEMVYARRAHRSAYQRYFASIDGVDVFGGSGVEDNCWLTSIVVDKSLSWGPKDLMGFLGRKKIETRLLWKPMHSQPLYSGNFGVVDGTADFLFQRGLALPSGSGMSEPGRARVLSEIDWFLNAHR